MGQKLDRVMYEISVVYIALPVFIFLACWLRLAVAIPVCIVFLVSLFLMLKNRPEKIAWQLTPRNLRVIIAAIILLLIWVFLSGQGGFVFQNSDYDYRNAIFHDLINKPWPVVYNFSSSNAVADINIANTSTITVLTYYIGFWLPGALVGKLFGWYAANVFLYCWSFLGLVLITYFLFRTLRSVSIWSVLILIFFSGLDAVGYILLYKGELPGLIDHIEWWSGLQYSSNTTLLFWVFNQTIAIWLAILLILNLKNSRSLFFLYAMLLLQGPFPFLGMLPIVLWKAYQGYPLVLTGNNIQRTNFIKIFLMWFWNGVRRAITFENIGGGISVLAIVFLYLNNNISASKSGTNSLSFNYYFGFLVFEFGLYAIFLFVDHGRKPLYWICALSLLIIPFFTIGVSQDFCMRVSIPALFLLQIMIQQTLLSKAETEISPQGKLITISERDRRLVRIILIVFMIFGAIVPLQEMARTVVYTLPPYNFTWSDSVKTLQDDAAVAENFMGWTDDNLFYEYLARQ